MDNNAQQVTARAGTAGGTLLVFIVEISSSELLKTTVLAAVGAVVSFTVSLGLRYLVKKIRKKRN